MRGDKMRLPNIKYSDSASDYEQIQFGGIDRRLGSSDGSLFNMINISTDSLPILTTSESYKIISKDGKYKDAWYYGMSDKPYIIAGKYYHDTIFPLWDSSKTYKVGDVVRYNKRLYICKKKISTVVSPPFCTEHWNNYTESSFEYDAEYVLNRNWFKAEVCIFNSKAYICIKDHNSSIDAEGGNWIKYTGFDAVGNYVGEYNSSETYSQNNIVSSLNGDVYEFYKFIYRIAFSPLSRYNKG